MNRTIIYLLLLVTSATAVITTGCRQDGPDSVEATLYDIVCLSEVSKQCTRFTLTKPGNDDVITYSVNGALDTTHVKVGERLLLAYRTNKQAPYTSGFITPIGYSLITNDTLTAGYISNVTDWNRDPVYLTSVWMSQHYLNIRARLPYDTQPRLLTVMVDSLTIGDDYPDCYLIHRLEEPINTFDRSYYMSFDVKALLDRPSCRGFNLILNNSNLPRDEYRFDISK